MIALTAHASRFFFPEKDINMLVPSVKPSMQITPLNKYVPCVGGSQCWIVVQAQSARVVTTASNGVIGDSLYAHALQ